MAYPLLPASRQCASIIPETARSSFDHCGFVRSARRARVEIALALGLITSFHLLCLQRLASRVRHKRSPKKGLLKRESWRIATKSRAEVTAVKKPRSSEDRG